MFIHTRLRTMVRGVVLALAILVCALSSCRRPKELVYQNIQNFSLKQGGLDKTTLTMDIRLYNPNRYTLKLKNAAIDVYMNGRPLGKITSTHIAYLSGLDTTALPVTLQVDMSKVLPNVLEMVMGAEPTIKLNGTIKAGRHGLYISIPVSYEGKQDIMSGLKF